MWKECWCIAPQVYHRFMVNGFAHIFFLENDTYLSWHYKYLLTRPLIVLSSPKMTKSRSHTGIWQRIYCYHHRYPICYYWFNHYAKVDLPYQYARVWSLILSWRKRPSSKGLSLNNFNNGTTKLLFWFLVSLCLLYLNFVKIRKLYF